MKRRRISAFLCALLLVVCLSCSAVVPAHAMVLDPVAWLYPIWVAYGSQAGVTVTSMGGDDFAQQGFSALFNEWQQSRVAAGFQETVQTLAEFVDTVAHFVRVTSGNVSGGLLNTVLALSSGIVEPLAQFWNWIIADKLGGSSVDSTDFNSSSGNVAASTDLFAGQPYAPVSPFEAQYFQSQGTFIGETESGRVGWFIGSNVSGVYIFKVGSAYYGACAVDFRVALARIRYSTGVLEFHAKPIPYYSETFRLYYSSQNIFYNEPNGIPAITFPSFSSIDSALEYIAAGNFSTGSITVAPDAGVDVLGFPDTDDPDYVPADTNIGWNVPYDQTMDTNGYLQEAYEKALDNTLFDEEVDNSTVEGSDVVGNVGQYIAPGLGSVFPFCLPFDIYNFLSALAAEPVAPHFTASLDFPDALGGAQIVDIDFDNPTFNTLAQLLRLMELLAFIVGLAYVTRSMFIRG